MLGYHVATISLRHKQALSLAAYVPTRGKTLRVMLLKRGDKATHVLSHVGADTWA